MKRNPLATRNRTHSAPEIPIGHTTSPKKEKQWTFQNETQQTILNPAHVATTTQQGQIKIQHRKLSNGALDELEIAGATTGTLANARGKDEDKTFPIYHWKCDLKKKSGTPNSTPTSPTTQLSPSPAFNSPTSPAPTAGATFPPAPNAVLQQNFVPKQDYDKLAARVDRLEQQVITLLNQNNSLTQRYNELYLTLQMHANQSSTAQMASMNAIDLSFSNQQNAPTPSANGQNGAPAAAKQDNMDLQFDFDDDEIRNLLVSSSQKSIDSLPSLSFPSTGTANVVFANMTSSHDLTAQQQQQQAQSNIMQQLLQHQNTNGPTVWRNNVSMFSF